MPTFRTGNMWDVFDTTDHFIITTNAFVKNNGALVMGAGIAKQVRDRWPGIDVEIGQTILRICGNGGAYGLILQNKLGVFQVKHHFKHQANLALIKKSSLALEALARANPDKTYSMNYPGIGNGHLNKWAVEPLLLNLPDNVEIWTFH